MFEYITGILSEASPVKVTIDVQGLGYRLFIPLKNYGKLPKMGAKVTLFVSTVIREDSQKSYGFLSRHERDLFESLIDVSGIGPKIGLSLIGHMEIDDLQTAISQGNTLMICNIPGIGKKTAERLIIEMRDKVKKGAFGILQSIPLEEGGETGVVADAISALINLGYNAAQSQKAIKTALTKTEGEPELARLITTALRSI